MAFAYQAKYAHMALNVPPFQIAPSPDPSHVCSQASSFKVNKVNKVIKVNLFILNKTARPASRLL